MHEQEKRPHVVKLRVNASGRRMIGILDLPEAFDRVSDLLNSEDPFLLVKPEFEPDADDGDDDGEHVAAILKDAVSYVEALEEQRSSALSSPPAGAFEEVLVELALPSAVLRASIFVPEGQALADVLNDERRFVSLRSVEFLRTVETYRYLAIGKRRIVMVKARSHEPSAETGR